MNLVATLPFVEVVIWSGSMLTSEKGKTSVVGNPVLIVLIWNVTGILLSSTDSKYTSQLVTNTPPS